MRHSPRYWKTRENAGAEFQRPLERLDGLRVLAVVHERLAEAEVGEVIVRVALDHVAVVGDLFGAVGGDMGVS